MLVLSYVIPVALFFLGVTFRKSKLISLIMILYLWIIYGMNTNTPDWKMYELYYYYPMSFNIEPLYRLICVFFSSVGYTYEQFRIIYCAIYMVILFAAIKRITSDVNFVFSFMMIWPFFANVSSLRFPVAAVIVLYAVPYLLDRSTNGIIKFVLAVLLACTIHTGSFLFLILLFGLKKFTYKQYAILFLIDIVLVVSIRLNILGEIAKRLNIYRLAKWLDMTNPSIPHLNLVGFSANSFFVVAFVIMIRCFTNSLIKERRKMPLKSLIVMQKQNSGFGIARNKGKAFLTHLDIIKECNELALYNSLNSCLLFIIPLYILSSEYQRYVSAMLVIYYSILSKNHVLNNQTVNIKKLFANTMLIILVVLFSALYLYSNQGHLVYNTLFENSLFQSVV